MIKKKRDFVNKAKKIHNNKYGYSKFNYIGATIKGIILCPIHGEFLQTPNNHLTGRGCNKCGIIRCGTKQRFTIENFIEKATKIHGHKYNYERFKYAGAHQKGIILCPIHDEFWQTPNNHIRGQGCPKCYGNKKKSVNEFVEQSNQIHNDKYNYSKFDYKNSITKGIIICPEHGEFLQSPNTHLAGKGCPTCGKIKATNNRKLGINKFIKQSNQIHNNKYDYSKFVYINARTRGIIICPKHGEFLQSPCSHMGGSGCSKCYGNIKKTKEEFVDEANKIHNNRYDYSLVKYKNIDTKVDIICSVHGIFKQTPWHHLSGSGCRECNKEKLNKKFKKSFETFIQQANIVHNSKYDYSKFVYVNDRSKGTIICEKHGEFEQSPSHHLRGRGCPKCGQNSISKMSQLWLDQLKISSECREKSIKIGNKKYIVDGIDYSTNTIYEFYGDFWHGNPKIYKKEDINPACKKSFGELYKKTITRENILIKNGFKIISIWERDFLLLE